MTTAKLSVDIDTKEAYASLVKLRAEMQNQPHKLLISLDSGTLGKDIRRYLKESSFKAQVGVDTKAIGKAIDAEMAIARHVTINGAALTLRVREAVAAGLVGGVVTVGGVAGATGASGAAHGVMSPSAQASLVRAVQQMLVPALDELSKAALAIASAAKKTGVSREAGSPSASTSLSNKNQDGTTTKFSIPISPDKVAETMTEVRKGSAAKQIEKDVAATTRMLQSSSDKTLATRQRLARGEAAQMEREYDALQAVSAQMQAGRIASLGELSRRQAAIEASKERNELVQRSEDLRKIKADRAGGRLNETGGRAAQMAQRRAEMRELNELIKANESGKLLDETGGRASQMAQRRAEMRELNQLIKANETGKLLDETGGRAAQMAARKQARQDELNEVRRHFQLLKIAASEQYTSTGANRAAAQGTLEKFPNLAKQAMGPGKSQFFESSLDAERYRKVVNDVTPALHVNKDAHRALTGAMRDGHAAARGLAGSMGQMWLTYGNVAPLVAAASLGAALRSVIVSGKDLEYQLKFVSLLSDGASVSVSSFGQTIQGLMVGPVEAGKALRGLAQNGLEVGQAMGALPTILRLATAGEMSLMEAALGATGVMQAFALGVGDLPRVADVFTKAAAISNTSVSEMVEAMKQASTVADNYRIGLDETAATLAVFAQRNIRGSAAGTAMRNMVSSLANPTEQAKKAMAALHLEIYDGSNRLKPYGDILQEMSKKLSGVNEQSKNALLGAIFNERGFKGASALLADLDDYKQKLKEIKDESKDFTRKINEGLSQTTEGKLKSLMAEFQTATSTAFYGADSAVKNFTDSLRVLVASDGFKGFLSNLTSGLVTLTSTLVENGRTVLLLLGTWAGFGISRAIIVGLAGMTAALLGTEAGMLGAATAARVFGVSVTAASFAVKGFFAASTLGLSLLIAWGVEHLLLRQRVDDGTEAQKAFNNNLQIQSDQLAASSKALEKESARLDRRNQLMREGKGMSLAQAEREASRPVKEGKDADIVKANAEVQRLTAAKQAADDKVRLPFPGKSPRDRRSREASALEASEALALETKNRDKLISALKEQEGNFQDSSKNQRKQDFGSAIEAARVFNKGIDSAMSNNPKLNLERFKVNPEMLAAMGKESAEDFMRGQETELSKQLRTVTIPKADGAARAEDLAKSNAAVAEIKRGIDLTKEGIKFARELDEARYGSNRFGPFLAAKEAELRAERDLLEIENERASAMAAFDKQIAKFSEANKVNLQEKKDAAKFDLDAQVRRLQQNVVLAKVKAGNAAADESGQDKNDLRKLADESQKQLQDIYAKYNVKSLTASQGAEMEARLKTEDIFRSAISKSVQDLELAQANVNDLQVKSAELTGMGKENAKVLIRELQKQEQAEQRVLNSLRARAGLQADLAGSAAKAEQKRSETAAFGWDKFWVDYVKSADTAATQVEAILKKTTDGMAQSLASFISTGKFGFSGLAKSILADVTKLWSNQQVAKLSNFFGSGGAEGIGGSIRNMFGGGSKGTESPQAAFKASELLAEKAAETAASTALATSTALQTTAATASTTAISAMAAAASQAAFALSQVAGGGAGSGLSGILGMFKGGLGAENLAGGGFGTGAEFGFEDLGMFFADGGVMTSQGRMPLRRYAAGGVAHGPQVSVHGEGSLPEANVPLQDGRTIPVTLKGDAGGSRPSVSLSYAPTIQIDSRTDQAQIAQMVGSAVNEGNRQMMQHLRDTGALA